VAVDMGAISMNPNNEGVAAFSETHSQFVTDFLRFLRRYLTWFERFPNMISYYIAPPLTAPGNELIFLLRKIKFFVSRARIMVTLGDI